MTAPSAMPYADKAKSLANSVMLSQASHLRGTHTERVWTYRAYQGGEPGNMIDWKRSARGREIFVREHEPLIHKDVFFWSNFSLNPNRLEGVTTLLLALAHILVAKERRIGWLLPTKVTTEALHFVAPLFEKGMTGALEPADAPPIHKIQNGLIILATSLGAMRAPFDKAIRSYAAQGNNGILIDLDEGDNAEVDITAARRNGVWPILRLDPSARPDVTLALLLQTTIEATR